MSLVPDQLIEAEWNCPAFGRTREVVLIDHLRLFTPYFALVPEVPDQFLLLGVNTDDRPSRSAEDLSL
jgi:hypothetical protein